MFDIGSPYLLVDYRLQTEDTNYTIIRTPHGSFKQVKSLNSLQTLFNILILFKHFPKMLPYWPLNDRLVNTEVTNQRYNPV